MYGIKYYLQLIKIIDKISERPINLMTEARNLWPNINFTQNINSNSFSPIFNMPFLYQLYRTTNYT